MSLVRCALALGAVLAGCGGGSQGGQDATADAASPDASAPEDMGAPPGDAMPEASSDSPRDVSGDAAGWRPLFDGASLAGWQRFLGRPSAGQPPLGLENDPRGVFSVATLDGAPAIHITGEIFGALISDESFCDMHLRAQYKWGPKIWPLLGGRDAGFMYLSTGPLGVINPGGPALVDPPGSGAFMVSLEYQITHEGVGSIAALGPIDLGLGTYTPPAENPDGWNDIDITVRDGVISHVFEGVEVERGTNPVVTFPGQAPTPMKCGKLQIQSEGSEIFFRNIEIQME